MSSSDKPVASARLAEAAWERVVEIAAHETARRSDPPRSTAAADPVADRWRETAKR